jgi:hypothetical protein
MFSSNVPSPINGALVPHPRATLREDSRDTVERGVRGADLPFTAKLAVKRQSRDALVEWHQRQIRVALELEIERIGRDKEKKLALLHVQRQKDLLAIRNELVEILAENGVQVGAAQFALVKKYAEQAAEQKAALANASMDPEHRQRIIGMVDASFHRFMDSLEQLTQGALDQTAGPETVR